MQRFAVLDAFRGLFAMMIVFFHMKDYNWVTNNSFVNNSDLFVNFFFVLSGFVIAFVYYDKINSGKALFGFVKNRFKRVYPLHIYTLLVFAAFELSKGFLYRQGYFEHVGTSNNTLQSFVANIFLLNATPVNGGKGLSWNYPSWSISAEFVTYIFFGLLMYFLRKSSMLKAAISAAVPVLMIIVSRSINSLVFGAVLGFFTGVIVYRLYAKYPLLKKTGKIAGTLLEAAVFILIVMMIFNKPFFQDCLYVYCFLFALSIYIFSFETGMISTFLKTSFFQTMGKYSYSIYLNHAIVIEVVNFLLVRLFKLESAALYIVPFVIAALTFAYSALTYRFIETRFYRKHVHK